MNTITSSERVARCELQLMAIVTPNPQIPKPACPSSLVTRHLFLAAIEICPNASPPSLQGTL